MTKLFLLTHLKMASFRRMAYQEKTKNADCDRNIMAQSKLHFAPWRWRLVMAVLKPMRAGRGARIISDAWVPPPGPNWENFSLRSKERAEDRIPYLLGRDGNRKLRQWVLCPAGVGSNGILGGRALNLAGPVLLAGNGRGPPGKKNLPPCGP